MLIQHRETGTKGLFFVAKESHILAELAYTMANPSKMIIEHTEVSDELKGQHIGNDLVDTAVEYARNHTMKIVPLCPFANALFKRKKEYADVLYTD